MRETFTDHFQHMLNQILTIKLISIPFQLTHSSKQHCPKEGNMSLMYNFYLNLEEKIIRNRLKLAFYLNHYGKNVKISPI